MKMIFVPPSRRASWFVQAGVKSCLFLLLVASFGCKREEIQVYTAPKEKRTPPSPAVADSPSPRAQAPRPQVTWVLPAGWQEEGSDRMNVAKFSVKGPGDTQAQVTITPLPQLMGRDAQIVNMWREQVGQEPLSADEAARQFTPVDIGGEQGNLFEIAGTPGQATPPARIVTAMVHRSDASWFYKLSGDSALVETQKPVFIEFLKSIRLKEAPPDADTTSSDTPKPKWTVPGQWQEVAPGQMQMAKFTVPARGSAKAEVSVSIFPNDTGGTLANVNRWRGQIGLPAVQQSELGSIVSPLDPSNPDAILVDMKSDSKRMLGAIVPRGGSYWFYKLTGDAEAVAPEKESFVAFVKSQP
jgi:hypothetical protein